MHARRCVYQEEDEQGLKGIKVSKDLMEIGGDALKTNITTLGPLVLPLSEQILFFATLVWTHFFGGRSNDVESASAGAKPSTPSQRVAPVLTTNKIKKPSDLNGKRIGVQLYTMTAAVWQRGIWPSAGRSFSVEPESSSSASSLA